MGCGAFPSVEIRDFLHIEAGEPFSVYSFGAFFEWDWGAFLYANGMGLPLYEAVSRRRYKPPERTLPPGMSSTAGTRPTRLKGGVCSPLLQLGSCRAGLQQAGRMKDAMISTSIRFPTQRKS